MTTEERGRFQELVAKWREAAQEFRDSVRAVPIERFSTSAEVLDGVANELETLMDDVSGYDARAEADARRNKLLDVAAVSNDLDWDEIPFERAGLLEEHRTVRQAARLWRLQEKADAAGVLIYHAPKGRASLHVPARTKDGRVECWYDCTWHDTRRDALEAWDETRKGKEEVSP
jgi:hypothetical protein